MDGDQRATRRAFIRQHHPDRGGNPETFINGLRELSPTDPSNPDSIPAPVGVYRTRRFNPARWLRRHRKRHRNRNLR